ncbi:AgmX/PglI C-terminal domain-containing protein [Turneriella parva]|uniref:TonB family protein n=1 Tax=Turneriella parva (strain ATCC BAA-1111 / DSM 21527 / NCTC 11395 / H) TaxID=869212 RepID=I4B6D1_TURPD|nr:AgmX/PglI C-terminal domain-containing protein [Turneriella parva]AFM12838.1 hypothetical protein Turpa_2193 [Turneriella parva DSM 21527]
MQKIYKFLPYAISGVTLIAAVTLYVENRRQNAQLVELLSRQNSDGKKQVDPYIAGPVKNRILKGYPELHACYKAFLESKPAQKSGKLRIDWQIATSGRVISPEVVTTELGNKPFETCIMRKIAEWRFPEPPVQKYVEHTFRFDEKGEAEKATVKPR